MASSAGNVAIFPSLWLLYNRCNMVPTISDCAVFCQWSISPFPSGSTSRVARFCTSPTSWPVPRRISSKGLKPTQETGLAGSKRNTLLPACACRHPAVSSHSSPLRSRITALCFQLSSVGITSPTPLPLRVGA